VAKLVGPKRAKLREAQEVLAAANAQLAEKQAALAEVEARLQGLQAALAEAQHSQRDLAQQVGPGEGGGAPAPATCPPCVAAAA
jgi:dynein heavy chain